MEPVQLQAHLHYQSDKNGIFEPEVKARVKHTNPKVTEGELESGDGVFIQELTYTHQRPAIWTLQEFGAMQLVKGDQVTLYRTPDYNVGVKILRASLPKGISGRELLISCRHVRSIQPQ